MKKRFDIPTTFVVTGIIQAAFLLAYALSLLFIRYFQNDFNLIISCLLIIAPVMPICFSMNFSELTYARGENGKGKKEAAKWLYVILSALIMLVAWIIYGALWVSITGGV